ncbi:hypothetical protein QBC43DRAFT_310466 [Cladorrhinum sp. PSN259]|nr:hypothetical protein QBC43DRAFT_310466 [Cladorrhinum sp. PSN259]
MMRDVFGAPYSNETVVWQSSPATRGSFTLLSTSVITLLLCVWSSIHLNLPGTGDNAVLLLLRRLKWIAVGLFMPEALVVTALSQHQRAKRILMEARQTFKEEQADQEQPPAAPRRKHPWTMTHSYWAIMGGIAADPVGERFLPKGVCPLFTSSGVSFLLRHEPDLVPDISEEDIKDKSKGGSFAKGLACIQATWFCATCIGRVAQHLPLSQLELNTFAHALCTVIVYVLWWMKPLDISIPHAITDARIRPLTAYAWMASKTSAIIKPKIDSKSYTLGRDPEFEAISCKPRNPPANPPPFWQTDRYTTTKQRLTKNPDPTEPKIIVTPQKCLSGTDFYVNYESTRWKYSITTSSGTDESTKVSTDYYREPAEFHLAPADVERWKLASQAIASYGLEKPDKNLDLVSVRPIPETVENPRSYIHIHDIKKENTLADEKFLFALISGIYGGAHALAWDSTFPNEREKTVWRVASLFVAAPAAAALAVMVLAAVASVGRQRWKRSPAASDAARTSPRTADGPGVAEMELRGGESRTNPVFELLRFLLKSAFGIMVCFYLAARVYLVWESFRTVFCLPPEAFKETEWSEYLPHIT